VRLRPEVGLKGVMGEGRAIKGTGRALYQPDREVGFMDEMNETKAGQSCRIGGCGGPGVCPGIALLIGFGIGAGLSSLTGIDWLMPVAMIGIGGLLISGLYKRLLPKRRA
jgi:hypothetical protein